MTLHQDPRPVLDHGFVRVVDTMGDDAAIVQAARVSYGKGTKSTSDDTALIRYLVRHSHTSPIEMCEIKLHLKMPMFIARQWMRHRTASINEYSGRYSEMKDECYLPDLDRFTTQSTTNKQGSSNTMSEFAYITRKTMQQEQADAHSNYQSYLDDAEISRELARINLPLSTYTEFYWKIDLHNLLHFLRLRMDSHAQQEIRDYANVIAEIVSKWVPATWSAFCDYKLNAVTFSAVELEALQQWLPQYAPGVAEHAERTGLPKREVTELLDKLNLQIM